MSKIHLEIEIPGNAKTYEFVLDDRMKIGTAKFHHICFGVQ